MRPKSTFLTIIPSQLVYLSISFILQLLQVVSRTMNYKNKWVNHGGTHASYLKAYLLDVVLMLNTFVSTICGYSMNNEFSEGHIYRQNTHGCVIFIDRIPMGCDTGPTITIYTDAQ